MENANRQRDKRNAEREDVCQGLDWRRHEHQKYETAGAKAGHRSDVRGIRWQADKATSLDPAGERTMEQPRRNTRSRQQGRT